VKLRSKLGILGGLAVASIAVPLVMAPPASADEFAPPPCHNRNADYGDGDTFELPGPYKRIVATWYNCGGTGNDRVKVVIDGGTDSACFTVGQDKTYRFDWSTAAQWESFDHWARC